MTASKWLVRLCMAASAVWSAVFIARSAVTIDGQRYFTLFDDAMISMRYARHLADGDGLVWNAGEPAVEGYTNFLWTIWMTVLHWMPLPDRLTPLLVSITGAALLVTCVWLSARVAAELVPTSAVAPVCAAVLTATSYPLVFWTLRGMEVGLVSVLATASVLLVLRLRAGVTQRRSWLLAGLLVAAVLTRPDALLITIVLVPLALVVVHRRDRRRLLFPLVAVPVLALVVQTGSRLAYYGELVPNTYALKVSNVPIDDRLQRGALAMLELLGKGALLLPLGLAAAGAIASVRDRKAAFVPVLVPASVVVLFLVYSVYVGGDAWESLGIANRYVSTVLPLMFALAGIGAAALAGKSKWVAGAVALGAAGTVVVAQVDLPAMDALTPARTEASTWVYLGVVLALLGVVVRKASWAGAVVVGAFLATSAPVAHTWWKTGAQLEDDDRVSARHGHALSRFTVPGTRIAVSSAGNIAYFAGDQRTFIDELGKMDPVIAARQPNRLDFPPGHQKWDYVYTFGVLQPDVIAQSFGLTPEERNRLLGAGWQEIDQDAFVRAGAPGVDLAGLRAFNEGINAGAGKQ